VAGSLHLGESEVPALSEGEVLLRVLRIGVCGTDRDIAAGLYGEAPPGESDLVTGHESLCRVEDPGASAFRKGDLVVPTVRRGCPERCLNCRSGESDMCLTGHYTEHGIKGLHGFAREFAVTDPGYVVSIPEPLGEEGVLMEPLSIAEKAISQLMLMQNSRMKWEPKKVLVLGAGPVGLLATVAAALRGWEVSALATRPEGSLKATLVESVGAKYIDAKQTPLASLGSRWDIVLEATGNSTVALEAERLAGTNGVVCYLGIYRARSATSDVGRSFTDLVLGNKVWFGSVNANRSYFEKGRDDLVTAKKKWPGLLGKMITKVVTPEDFRLAFEAGEEDLKAVIEFA
jgi:glucose 1-dehydrogenase